MMYEIVTNLDGLTTGTAAYPGWSPEKETKPSANPKFKGKTLWPYGEGGCAPQQKSSNMEDVNRIVSATKNKSWDGVDFDDECNMNVPLVIETMKQLKQEKRGISFRFIAGYIYNHLHTENGKNRITK